MGEGNEDCYSPLYSPSWPSEDDNDGKEDGYDFDDDYFEDNTSFRMVE